MSKGLLGGEAGAGGATQADSDNSSAAFLGSCQESAGGVHAQSKMAVAKGIDWPAARQLWLHTFTRLAPDADFKKAALAQVTEGKNRGFDVLHTVAPGATSSVAPSAPDCQGRSSGWFCSNSIKNSAVQSADGAVVNSVVCSDTEQSCKKMGVDAGRRHGANDLLGWPPPHGGSPSDLPAGDAKRGAIAHDLACKACYGSAHDGAGRAATFTPILSEEVVRGHSSLAPADLRLVFIGKARMGAFVAAGACRRSRAR